MANMSGLGDDMPAVRRTEAQKQARALHSEIDALTHKIRKNAVLLDGVPISERATAKTIDLVMGIANDADAILTHLAGMGSNK